MRLNNPSRIRKDYKQVKNEQNCRVSSTEKSSNGLPFGSFSRKNKICSSLARTISASRRSFFENLTIFERCIVLNKFSPLKIVIFKTGWLSSHRFWGFAHLSLEPEPSVAIKQKINQAKADHLNLCLGWFWGKHYMGPTEATRRPTRYL